MKKSNAIFAILAMAIVAIAVAIVSCKKDDTVALSGQSTAKAAFAPPQVDDMNAYLKAFKQKMQSAAKGDDVALSIEEAAWHLSNVANYEYSNANVEFTDLRYDTLYFDVVLTEGKVLMQDLNTVYSNIASDINRLYQDLDLQNKHIRFIKASISEEGVVSTQVITSYTLLSHTWFLDGFYYDTICDYYFSDDSVYIWNTLGAEELERITNLMEGHDYVMSINDLSGRVYFVYTMTHEFDFRYNLDPYGSPFNNNSRIYAVQAGSNATPSLSKDEMCYCLDSYLGLPHEFISGNINYNNQSPVLWKVEGFSDLFAYQHFYTYYHKVTVDFAQRITSGDNPIND